MFLLSTPLAVLTILMLPLAAEVNGQSVQPPGGANTTRLEQLVTIRRAQVAPECLDVVMGLARHRRLSLRERSAPGVIAASPFAPRK
jgi:hypothetical protein